MKAAGGREWDESKEEEQLRDRERGSGYRRGAHGGVAGEMRAPNPNNDAPRLWGDESSMGADDLFASGRTGRDDYRGREAGRGRGGGRGQGRGRGGGRGERGGGYAGFDGGHGAGGGVGRKEVQSAPTPDDFPALPGAAETGTKEKPKTSGTVATEKKEKAEVQGWEKPVGEWADDDAPAGNW